VSHARYATRRLDREVVKAERGCRTEGEADGAGKKLKVGNVARRLARPAYEGCRPTPQGWVAIQLCCRMRHAYISQKIKEEDVMKLSETMKHSPLATELYVRKIQPLLVENMIKIDERKLVYEEPEMIQTRSRVLEKRKREEEAKKKAKKGRVVVI
jgi:hypothetical protein